jgi:hypothetical protein
MKKGDCLLSFLQNFAPQTAFDLEEPSLAPSYSIS